MENNNSMGMGKRNIWIIGIAVVIILAVAIVLIGRTVGKDGKEGNGGVTGEEQNGGAAGQGEGNAQADAESQNGSEEELAVTAIYIPFGEGEHIFVGEQTGVFVATFPDEIYDKDGNKIGKEQLEKGNIVKIYGNGMMLESYPGQYPGITRMEVIEEGKPSDADAYQEIIDELYQEPDPSQPPVLNVEYTSDLAVVMVAVERGGYEWVYMDKDGLSNAVVADSVPVLDWKELADIVTDEPLDVTLSFSAEPQEVEVIRYDASLMGRAQENPDGETVTVEKRDGKFVLPDVDGGYVYDVTGIWENGRANYGFMTIKK